MNHVMGQGRSHSRLFGSKAMLAISISLAFLISSSNYSSAEMIGKPLHQIKMGISPQHVQCKADLELVFKSTDGSPACVSIFTKDKLVQRGWATNEGFGGKFAIGGLDRSLQ